MCPPPTRSILVPAMILFLKESTFRWHLSLLVAILDGSSSVSGGCCWYQCFQLIGPKSAVSNRARGRVWVYSAKWEGPGCSLSDRTTAMMQTSTGRHLPHHPLPNTTDR